MSAILPEDVRKAVPASTEVPDQSTAPAPAPTTPAADAAASSATGEQPPRPAASPARKPERTDQLACRMIEEVIPVEGGEVASAPGSAAWGISGSRPASAGLALFAAAAATPAAALDTVLCSGRQGVIAVAQGEFRADEEKAFSRFLAGRGTRSEREPVAVYFNSDGGRLGGGIALGQEILAPQAVYRGRHRQRPRQCLRVRFPRASCAKSSRAAVWGSTWRRSSTARSIRVAASNTSLPGCLDRSAHGLHRAIESADGSKAAASTSVCHHDGGIDPTVRMPPSTRPE